MDRKQLASIYGIGTALAATIVTFNEWDKVDQIINNTDKDGFRIITLADEAYPKLLKEIYDAPILFWLKGDTEVLNTDSIAIVGTRKASSYGKEMAEYFATELIKEGLTVTSGLAYGIDSIAHQASLKAKGRTIAVLGSGIDKIYPSKNIRLAHRIADQGGAVISEFPPGTGPDAGNFPVRNRIVSGLSLGTLVIESGLEGGSMITAKAALDQNREVFVVPHSVKNKTGAGCNNLIKTGQGKLIQTVEDILNEISIYRKPHKGKATRPEERKWKSVELDAMATSICELLEESPKHIDDIGEQLDVPVHVLLSKLLELEMQECVRQNTGKIFQLK